MVFFKKLEIKGCKARGDGDSVYLTRYTLFECNSWSLKLHVFHRSDGVDMHDHPWDFWTLPIWRGYREAVRVGTGEGYSLLLEEVKPWRLYFRPAEYIHRVILHQTTVYEPWRPPYSKEQKAITLIMTLKRRREWGFWVRNKWQSFTSYFADYQC